MSHNANQNSTYLELTPEELLGPLNDVEQKYAPEKLYVAGNTDFLAQGARVSIVGSRKASPEGIARARKLARVLVKKNTVVVSGLAEGIDTAAHSATIEAGGRTIAVIGTPLDKVYPKGNAKLQDLIQREHLCISQFPVGYPTRPGCFPMRNRTMALLSDATVIIEAGDTSGSLSQATETLRLGRLLFIAKSTVDNATLTWPQKYLDYGARILSDDTLEELFEALPPRSPMDPESAFSF